MRLAVVRSFASFLALRRRTILLAGSRNTVSGESLCSSAPNTRENTGAGSDRISSTASWRGPSRRADVGVGSRVSVACLSVIIKKI